LISFDVFAENSMDKKRSIIILQPKIASFFHHLFSYGRPLPGNSFYQHQLSLISTGKEISFIPEYNPQIKH
jgi:hypothetical protein